jgi:hypothetical protein
VEPRGDLLDLRPDSGKSVEIDLKDGRIPIRDLN